MKVGMFILTCVSILLHCAYLSSASVQSSTNSLQVSHGNTTEKHSMPRTPLSNSDLQISAEIVTDKSFEYKGCWIGEKGGALQIEGSKIKHLTKNEIATFFYKPVKVPQKDEHSLGVLLEVDVNAELEFLKPFVYLKFEGNDETLGLDKILLRGFETLLDFDEDRFVTSEYFYKNTCEKLNVESP